VKDPLQECIRRYDKYLAKLRKRFKRKKISFLRYQALSFKAIDDIVKRYEKSTGENLYWVKNNLLYHWIYSDPLIYALEKIEFLTRGLHEEKLEWIGKYLVKEFLKGRETRTKS